MKAILFITLLLFTGLTACNKDTPSNTVGPESAIIHNYGDPAVDGCGWIIETPTQSYSPINLPDNFKVDSLNVMLEYVVLDSWASCGLLADAYSEIEIINIQ